MYPLEKRGEWLAASLATAQSHTTYTGILAGHNPGDVWVDDVENPSSAVVWSSGLECFQFMGRIDNDSFNRGLGSFIDSTLSPFLKKKGINFFEFAADANEWYPIIYKSLVDQSMYESWQYLYSSNEESSETRSLTMPQNFEAISIDEELISSLEKRDYGNTDFIINYIEKYWGTVENYLRYGHGYAALSGNKFVSIALSTALYKTTQEIGVETVEDYRRNGLSSSLVRMLLNVFKEKEIKPMWDCSDGNMASQKTIEKAGLVRIHQYKVSWFYL